MPEPLWPTRRADGTASVAARYRVESAEALRTLEARVDAYLEAFAHSHGWQRFPELLRNPYVVSRQEGLADVIFDGSPYTKRWKDWMVLLVGDLRIAPLEGVSLVGFWDLVSGRSREFQPGGSMLFGDG